MQIGTVIKSPTPNVPIATTIHHSVHKLVPGLEATFRPREAAVGTSWRMDETDIKIGGQSKYLYRAVDKGATPSTSS